MIAKSLKQLYLNWLPLLCATFLFPLLSSAQITQVPYNSDSTFYRVDLALKNPDQCFYLFLEADTLQSLPKEFKSLKNLKGITFRYCLNANWSDIFTRLADLPSLKYLEISICDLKIIPENISLLDQITSLNVKSNLLEKLPQSIKGCDQLEYLNLSFNRYAEMSLLIDQLKSILKLRSVDLSNAWISELPDNFSALINLISLDLSDNRLHSLPEGFANLKSLQILDLSNNRLLAFSTELIKVTQLTHLKELNLYSNESITYH